MRLELPWPELATYPDYGLVRPRLDFDELLVRHAQQAGARLQERTTVTGPVLDRAGRVVGVTAKVGPSAPRCSYRAPLVIAADGSSARLALSLGIAKRDDRPMGVAVRRYFESPRHDDDMLESWLELRSDDGSLLPGYGWVFGVGDGTSNVGLGILNTTQAWQKTDYKELLARWTERHARRVAVRRRARHRPGARRALPMGFNRTPHYSRGVLLVGDAGGAVNPFNGEGIAYAMESGPARRRGRRPGARPPGRARRGSGRSRLPAADEGRLRRLLHARPRLRAPHRQPARHGPRDPPRAAAARCS
jgi:geranylgeranyl reductase family protein